VGHDLQGFGEALKASIEAEQVETPLLVLALHPPHAQPEPESAGGETVDRGGLPRGDSRIPKRDRGHHWSEGDPACIGRQPG
jgi:hypothetical protein